MAIGIYNRVVYASCLVEPPEYHFVVDYAAMHQKCLARIRQRSQCPWSVRRVCIWGPPWASDCSGPGAFLQGPACVVASSRRSCPSRLLRPQSPCNVNFFRSSVAIVGVLTEQQRRGKGALLVEHEHFSAMAAFRSSAAPPIGASTSLSRRPRALKSGPRPLSLPEEGDAGTAQASELAGLAGPLPLEAPGRRRGPCRLGPAPSAGPSVGGAVGGAVRGGHLSSGLTPAALLLSPEARHDFALPRKTFQFEKRVKKE